MLNANAGNLFFRQRAILAGRQRVVHRDSADSFTMQADNVASGTPLPFGLAPTPLEAVAPGYIGLSNCRGRYYPMRTRARRGQP